MHLHPSYATPLQKKPRFTKAKGSGAPEGAIQPWPHRRMRQRAVRKARSPLGAPPRRSPRLWPLSSTPSRASWNYRVQTGGPSPAPVQRAPRRPVVMPAGTMPGAARERSYELRPRGPRALRFRIVS